MLVLSRKPLRSVTMRYPSTPKPLVLATVMGFTPEEHTADMRFQIGEGVFSFGGAKLNGATISATGMLIVSIQPTRGKSFKGSSNQGHRGRLKFLRLLQRDFHISLAQ